MAEMKRADILNALAKRHGYRRYLEIGLGAVDAERSSPHVKLEHMESVDPFEADATHVCTSDDFFADARPAVARTHLPPWNLIFIDGLHVRDQVLRDVDNALACLAPGGAVVLHDCNPVCLEHTDPGINGTVWEAWAYLRLTQPQLDMQCVDTDQGCGVLRRSDSGIILPGTLPMPAPVVLDYAFLDAHRVELMGLVSPEDWRASL